MIPPRPLKYSIYASSDDGPPFGPHNIITDDPRNVNSRWSGGANHASWIMLKLEKLAVLDGIVFGKFFKGHPCSLKDVKILIGTHPDHLTEVLHASLRDDPVPEHFAFPNASGTSLSGPVCFVRLEPISAHGIAFNASIWHVKLIGVNDEEHVQNMMDQRQQHHDEHVTLLVLKYLRKKSWLDAYSSLLRETGLELEHPLTSQLYTSFVTQGSWDDSICLLSTLGKRKFIRKPPAQVTWKRVVVSGGPDGEPIQLNGRAMCFDYLECAIYLFGEMVDSIDDSIFHPCLQKYSVSEARWSICADKLSDESTGFPSPECKMVMDPVDGCIYFFGSSSHKRFVPEESSTDNPRLQLASEDSSALFFRYFTRGTLKGRLQGVDCGSPTVGRPPPLWDHQMAIDLVRRRIYVYGGNKFESKRITSNSDCYEYNLNTAKWINPWHNNRNPKVAQLPARFDHALLAVSNSQTSFVVSLGGTAADTGDDLSTEMISYDPQEDVFRARYDAPTSKPTSACVDPDSGDIFSLHGTPNVHAEAHSSKHLPPNLSIFDFETSAWIDTTSFEETSGGSSIPMSTSLDWNQPSFYDPIRSAIYTFGKESNDFWRGRIHRVTLDWIVRKLTFYIRAQQFREKCEGGTSSVEVLLFLKKFVSPLVDHDAPDEHDLMQTLVSQLLSSRFTPLDSARCESAAVEEASSMPALSGADERQKGDCQLSSGLPTSLLQPDSINKTPSETPQQGARHLHQRRAVFEQIIFHLKPELREPAEDLAELVSRVAGA